MKARHQKQSLNPHAILLTLPTLNISQNSAGILQRKIQRGSSFTSEALLDKFQKALADTSHQRILNGSSVVQKTCEDEPKRRNDKILILMRNELKEVLKNSPERKLFEGAKNHKKHNTSRSIIKLKEELTNQTFEKSPEPYLKGLIEDSPTIPSEKNLPTLLRSSGVTQLKRSIIPCPKPVRVFHNEKIHQQIREGYYLKNTITEMDSDSDSSILSVLGPIEQRNCERSGSSRVHTENLPLRCMTEASESPDKQNSIHYQRPSGLFVVGNKPFQIAKTLNKPKSVIIGIKKHHKIRTQPSEDSIEIKRVRAKSIPSYVFFK